MSDLDPKVSSRVAAPSPEDLDERTAKLLAKLPSRPDGPLNLMAVLIHNPDLLRGWGRFTGLLFPGRLPARERELLILRTAWNVQSSYEWGNHVELAREAGMTDDELARLTSKETGPDWPEDDRLLVGAADQLHHDGELSEEAWRELTSRFSVAGAIEIIFVVGVYHVVRSLVGSLGVADEPGKPALGQL